MPMCVLVVPPWIPLDMVNLALMPILPLDVVVWASMPGGSGFDAKGNAIANQFPYDDCLLTMDELVFKLGLPSLMPLESCRHIYLFYGKLWCPKVKFEVELKVPLAGRPLSKKALEMTYTILSK
jgi:hypothetical protein